MGISEQNYQQKIILNNLHYNCYKSQQYLFVGISENQVKVQYCCNYYFYNPYIATNKVIKFQKNIAVNYFTYELDIAAAHGLSQATISGIFKGEFSNFGSDFAAGAISSLVGSGINKLQIDNPALRKLTMYLGGAISGGLAASVTGGDFLDGAATGLIVTALNHGLHEAFDPQTSEQQEQKNEKKVNDCLKDKNVDYEPDKAVDYMERKYNDNEPNHNCASAVREGVDYGGIDTRIRGTNKLEGVAKYYAKNYDLNLEKWGFTDMKISSLDGYTPKNGDIAVIQNHKGGNIAGHIQMYSAKLKAWISDFKQNKPFYPGDGYQRNQPSFKIYRYIKN